MKLLIKPLNESAVTYYSNHKHFHEGDAGLDLYILQHQTIKAGDIAHLKSTFQFIIESSVSELIKDLHPAPAVCGIPLELSKKIILNNPPDLIFVYSVRSAESFIEIAKNYIFGCDNQTSSLPQNYNISSLPQKCKISSVPQKFEN